MIASFIEADSLSLGAFCVLILAMLCVLLIAANRIDSSIQTNSRFARPTQLGLMVFLAFFSLIVSSGVLNRYFIPLVPILFVGIIGLCIWFSFSRYGSALSRAFPLHVLIGFQCFRLPLEFILHEWSIVGTVPETMTWTGQNYDIVSGMLAFIVAPFVSRNRDLAWIPTGIGFLLLLNVLRVVVMSSPFPFSWDLERPLQLIMHLPYALIVPLCVAPALIGHLVVIRELFRTKSHL